MKPPNVTRCVLCGALVAALGRHGSRELDDLTTPHRCGPGAPLAGSPVTTINRLLAEAADGADPERHTR